MRELTFQDHGVPSLAGVSHGFSSPAGTSEAAAPQQWLRLLRGWRPQETGFRELEIAISIPSHPNLKILIANNSRN